MFPHHTYVEKNLLKKYFCVAYNFPLRSDYFSFLITISYKLFNRAIFRNKYRLIIKKRSFVSGSVNPLITTTNCLIKDIKGKMYQVLLTIIPPYTTPLIRPFLLPFPFLFLIPFSTSLPPSTNLND